MVNTAGEDKCVEEWYVLVGEWLKGWLVFGCGGSGEGGGCRYPQS